MNIELSKINSNNFNNISLEVFRYQYNHIDIYRKYCELLKIDIEKISSFDSIPFLPIEFFKTHIVAEKKYDRYFKSSGTTESNLSYHYIKDISVYNESIMLSFEHFFGDTSQYEIFALLPHYLERSHSSLVYMVKYWMRYHTDIDKRFYLYNYEELYNRILNIDKPILLIGISFALLEFASKYNINNCNLTIIETGGMKGRGGELLKIDLISRIQKSFPNSKIISEYGMCELMSQAFSDENLYFSTSSWMKVLLGDLNDPFVTKESGIGPAKIIDLANYNSCSYIETKDLIRIDDNGRFKIIGRVDNSDIRGCSLMY